MGDETRRVEERLDAAFARMQKEIAEAATRYREEVRRELAGLQARRAASGDPSARVALPTRDPRLAEGSPDERAEVFLELVARLEQPFVVEDATQFTRLGRRTVERHIAKGMDWGRLERVGKGKYRVVSKPPAKE